MTDLLCSLLVSRGGVAAFLLAYVPWRDVVNGLAATCSKLRLQLLDSYVLGQETDKLWVAAQCAGWQRVSAVHVNDEMGWCVGDVLNVDAVRTMCWQYDPSTRTHTFRNVASLTILPDKGDLTGFHRRERANTLDALCATAMEQLGWPLMLPRLERITLLDNGWLVLSFDTEVVAYINLVLAALCFNPQRDDAHPVRELRLRACVPYDDPITTEIMQKLAQTLETLKCHVRKAEAKAEESASWFHNVPTWPALRTLDVDYVPRHGEPPLRLHAPHLQRLRIASLMPWDAEGFRDISPATCQALRELSLIAYEQADGYEQAVGSEVALGFLPTSLECLRPTRFGNFARHKLVSLPPGLRVLEIHSERFDTRDLGEADAGKTQLDLELPLLERFIGPPAHLDPIRTPRLREVVWHARNAWNGPGAFGETPNWLWQTVAQRECLRLVVFVTCKDPPVPVPVPCRPWVTHIQMDACQPCTEVVREALLESFGLCPRLSSLHVTEYRDEALLAPFRAWAHSHRVAFTTRSIPAVGPYIGRGFATAILGEMD